MKLSTNLVLPGIIIGILAVCVYLLTSTSFQFGVVSAAGLAAAVSALITLLVVRRALFPIICLVRDMSEKMHTNAAAIAQSMDQQSGVSVQLSSSVVEISSTMEEFSSTAGHIAQHSHSVVERADKTLEDTKVGAAEVENLTFKINDISQNIQVNLGEIVDLGKKSKEINKVKEIINNIANQTKLIAFNAALEAASAGEAGKRFGVVAVEIRRLADSVVESTAEIEGKITEILDSVNRLVMSSEKSSQLIQEGQEYASRTVSLLIESVDGVDETASAARQISLSTQQQQIASSQVFLALKNIEQGVRQSTDSLNQTRGATEDMLKLSERLRKLVSKLAVKVSNAESDQAFNNTQKSAEIR
jgi:methyl-accepting chemotaxis protein